jgi:hypothetical protein
MISGMRDSAVALDRPAPLLQAYTELKREAVVTRAANAGHPVITTAATVTRPAMDAFFDRHPRAAPWPEAEAAHGARREP